MAARASKGRGRRYLPVLTACVALVACGEREENGARSVAPSGGESVARDVSRDGLEAHSVQLHVHGSFSEGVGSIDSHSHEAAQLGVDVIWWSDHDFRITGHHRLSRLGFEAQRVPLDRGEDWTAVGRHHAKYLVPVGGPRAQEAGPGLSFVDEPVREGQRSLRLALARAEGEELVRYGVALEADRQLHRASLAAGLTVRVACWPESLGPDARAWVRVDLSEHAPRRGLGLEPYALRYELGAGSGEARRAGALYEIPLAVEPGRWNEVVLPISADAARGFDFVPPRDDVLFRLTFGVAARRGAAVAACFDDLRIDVERQGPEMYDVQREVLAQMPAFHPAVTQLQGVEISFASRHLNEFSLAPELLDYDAIAREVAGENGGALDERAFRRRVVELAVERAHARGGLVSYNHMFGSSMEGAEAARTREEQLAIMLRTRAAGADLLEVGYRDRGGADLADHLWVWDHMALGGLRLVGLGVSDSHGGPEERWSGRPNDFVSWILAPSRSREDLLEGLRAGAVFFGDIEHFDGRLDLVTARGWRMGQEVLTDRSEAEVEARLQGARVGDRLRFIVNGELDAELVLGEASGAWRHGFALPPEGSSLCRVELWGADGEERAFSNPIHFLRGVADEVGLEPARAALDVGGVRSVELAHVRLRAARAVGESVELELAGLGGRLVLEGCTGARLEGLEGRVAPDGERCTLTELTGEGRVVLHVRAGAR